ncbi:hypothetical protein B0H16DRAFT_1719412 [Mycena metata]|uniref:Uncharacterized protein n=1 Tax=Mycena metata TaxID=1033252 RepID=A0AAD7JEM8_9AGAR|nr:hypothetical protein B0H16DRAFT_1719412 [Mycena metata]
MPASHNQDRVAIIARLALRDYEVPPHLSKEVFEAKLGALLDAFMALPVCKKNVLKWDLIVPMLSLFDASIRAVGFCESQRHVLAVAEYEEFSKKFGAATDKFAALPQTQNTLQKHSVFLQNNTDANLQRINVLLRGLGLPVPAPVIVVMTQSKSQEDLIEVVKKLTMDMTAELECYVNNAVFMTNVQSKGNKA